MKNTELVPRVSCIAYCNNTIIIFHLNNIHTHKKKYRQTTQSHILRTQHNMNHVLVLSLTLYIFLTQGIKHVHSLAAGKKSRKVTQSAAGKGFGPAKPSILDKIHNRIPENAQECDCPCASGRKYVDCCAPFHNKEKLPGSPIDVLRSRYTAFAWRIPSYIIDTTHPACSDFRKDKVAWLKDLNRDGMFDSYDFISLEPGPQEISEDNDKEGFIEFRVHLQAKGKPGGYERGQEIVIREKSRFLCSGDPPGWLYAGGKVTSEIKGLEDVVLNNP